MRLVMKLMSSKWKYMNYCNIILKYFMWEIEIEDDCPLLIKFPNCDFFSYKCMSLYKTMIPFIGNQRSKSFQQTNGRAGKILLVWSKTTGRTIKRCRNLGDLKHRGLNPRLGVHRLRLHQPVRVNNLVGNTMKTRICWFLGSGYKQCSIFSPRSSAKMRVLTV